MKGAMAMKRLMKMITITMFLFVAGIFTTELPVQAEIYMNTTGEENPLDPNGGTYTYKYWDGNRWNYIIDSDYNVTPITYTVEYCYEQAYKMNAYVNAQRRAAGVHEVEMKDELMKVAMKRAAETAIYFSHNRPNGLSYKTISFFYDRENICGTWVYSAATANKQFVDSAGHYSTMIDEDCFYAGYGCVKVNGCYYWVQLFSEEDLYYEDGNPEKPVIWDELPCGNLKGYKANYTAQVNPEFVSLACGSYYPDASFSKKDTSSVSIKTGQRFTPTVYATSCAKDWNTVVPITKDQYNVRVLTPELCIYHSNGQVTALGKGTAKIEFSLKANPEMTTTMTINITGIGDTLVNVNGTYYYYKDGVRRYDTTLVKYGNTWWYVRNGVLNKNAAMVKYGNDYWYVAGGRLQRMTGLLRYNNKYWLVSNGKWYRKTMLYKYGNTWWYVKAGVLSRETTLVKHGTRWYFVQNGRLNRNYTGTFVYNGTRWKIIKGVVIGKY